jgi:hypothetical protein
MKIFNLTKQEYNHIFRAITLLTNFLHKHHQDFMIKVIGELGKHEWDGNY